LRTNCDDENFDRKVAESPRREILRERNAAWERGTLQKTGAPSYLWAQQTNITIHRADYVSLMMQ
jgi:hypothetical protein